MRFILFTLVSFYLMSAPAEAATRRAVSMSRTPSFGLGLIIGEPTGFTGKIWLESKKAVDFGLAYSFGNYVLVYADYLFQWPGAFRLRTGEKFFNDLVPYVGIGAAALFATSSPSAGRAYFGNNPGGMGLGLRIPLGVEWVPGEPPLGVFLEIAPGLGFVPLTYVFFQGGIGVRYYF